MAGRYYDRSQAIERARREVEALLAGVLLAAFARLWSLLFPKVRDGRTDQIDRMLDEWEYQLDVDYDDVLTLGGDTLARAETAWYAANGKDITIASGEVARDFISGNVNAFGSKPAIMIAENIRAGIKAEIAKAAADPNMTADMLNVRLRRWMDEARAKVISTTDTSNLLSAVTKLAMQKAGAGFWVWQTMEDDRVCAECMPLHGRVYAITDEMPPKHHNCRCYAVPLKQWLRAHDQPFYSIAEGLSNR